MSRVRLEKDTLYLATPAEVKQLATKLQSYGSTVSEREFKVSRGINVHDIILSRDEMRSFHWAIAHVLPRDIAARLNGPTVLESTNIHDVFRDLTDEERARIDTRRVNGQHSSKTFLALTDEEWPRVRFPVVIDWEVYACDTTKDRAYLFESIDTQWSSRSKDDRIGAHLGSHDELYTKLNRYLAGKALTGLHWYARKVECDAQKAAQQQEFLYANHHIQPFLVWFGQTAEKGVTRHLFNAPVIAAMYHTTQGANPKTQHFWKEIAKGYSAHANNTMAYKLSQFLSNLKNHHYNWKGDLKRKLKDTQLRPNDRDVFGTCLRVLAAVNNDIVLDDIFAPAENKTADKIAQILYPLDESPQAA